MARFLRFGNQRKFYLRDFRNAYQFRPDIAPPRQKFQGYVNFILNRALLSTLDDSQDFRTRISSLVKTATLPSIEFKTETKNSFNRKRIINTGVEYEPVSISVHDTIQNEWITLFMKYYSYLYMNARNKFSDGDRDPKTLYDKFSEYTGADGNKFGSGSTVFDSNQFGYNLPLTSNFFERIDIILYHGNKGVQYSLTNPMMTNFKPDTLDYSSSDVMQFDMTFAYENFQMYNLLNFDLDDTDKARFENMENVDLPGTYNPSRIPEALKETDLNVLGDAREKRGRTAQIHEAGGVRPGQLSSNVTTQPTYVSANGNNSDQSTGFLSGVNDFLEDTPFGRIIDSAAAGAVHGVDIFDSAAGQIVDEVAAAINNPQAGDIFDGRGINVNSTTNRQTNTSGIPVGGSSGQISSGEGQDPAPFPGDE